MNVMNRRGHGKDFVCEFSRQKFQSSGCDFFGVNSEKIYMLSLAKKNP